MTTLEEIKIERLRHIKENTNPDGTINTFHYPKSFIDKFLDIKLNLGLNGTAISQETGVPEGTVCKWTKKFRPLNSVVAMKYGNGARYDLPTKGMIVKRMVEYGELGIHIAEEIGVHQVTISAWRKQYANNYQELIDLPDGTMIIAKPEKIIYGLQNVRDYINYKQKQTENQKAAIILMQEGKAPRELINKMIENEEMIENEITILQQAETIMSD